MAAPSLLAPTAAERIRSACAQPSHAMLAIDGAEPAGTSVYHLLDDGSFAVTVPSRGTTAPRMLSAGPAGAHAVLELADCVPLPLREPVRSLVWVSGQLQEVTPSEVPKLLDLIATEWPNPALLQVDRPGSTKSCYRLLRLTIESAVVADSAGAESVGVSALLAAAPDPFAVMESRWLQHIATDHREVVDRLATKLPATLRRGRVHPLGIDRYGVRLRVEKEDRDHDVRLSFTNPADDVVALSRAIRVLMGCPFLNGLQARRL